VRCWLNAASHTLRRQSICMSRFALYKTGWAVAIRFR